MWLTIYYRKIYWLNSKWKAGLSFSLWDVIFILLHFLQVSPHFSSLNPLPTFWWSQWDIHRLCCPHVAPEVLAATWTRTAGTCLSKTTAGETWWNVHIYRWPCSIYNVKLESPVEIWLWDCTIEVSSRQLTGFLYMAWGTAVKFWD